MLPITPGPRSELWVIHLDMDAFYASVEQRDRPGLRGKPVIVGGPPKSRGVVATCSYEARKFGVRSAMPSREAYRLCPQGIFVRPNFARYTQVSQQIRAIMARYSETMEPLSLDEAYLDVTGQDALAVGRALKHAIANELGLTASVGISYCKLLSKLASDFEKPNGFTVIDHQRARELLPTLPVRTLHGVGPRTAGALRDLGIETCGQLLAYDAAELHRYFGRRADELLLMARGIDDRPVVSEHEAKSFGVEDTFSTDMGSREWLKARLTEYAQPLAQRLRSHGLRAKTVTVKIKWNVFLGARERGALFEQITRSHSLPGPTADASDLAHFAHLIFDRVEFGGRKVRLLGLSVSNLVPEDAPVQAYFKL